MVTTFGAAIRLGDHRRSIAPIRVVIADDHMVVRVGLTVFLRTFEDIEVVGAACDGDEAIRLCEELHPDIVLIDMMMPDADGSALIRALSALPSPPRVIALTSFADERLIRTILEAGAAGCLLKNVEPEDLAAAIRTVHAGQPALGPAAIRMMMRTIGMDVPPGHDLTEREREVLALLTEGLSNGAIACRLVISPSTVGFHVGNILAKLNAANRTEAVRLALEHHLVAQFRRCERTAGAGYAIAVDG